MVVINYIAGILLIILMLGMLDYYIKTRDGYVFIFLLFLIPYPIIFTPNIWWGITEIVYILIFIYLKRKHIVLFFTQPPLYKIGDEIYVYDAYEMWSTHLLCKKTIKKIQYSTYKERWKYYYDDSGSFSFDYEDKILKETVDISNLDFTQANNLIESKMKRLYQVGRILK
jgi:hypothetical protein